MSKSDLVFILACIAHELFLEVESQEANKIGNSIRLMFLGKKKTRDCVTGECVEHFVILTGVFDEI